MVGNAMARNKYIYCMALHAIVVSSTPNRGGTWTGAVENLGQGWVPLWVKETDAADSGNPRLVERGGRWLADVDDLVFANAGHGAEPGPESSPSDHGPRESSGGRQMVLEGTGADRTPDSLESEASVSGQVDTPTRGLPQEGRGDAVDPAEELYQLVRMLVAVLCAEPKEAKVIADALGVTTPTAAAWIGRLVEERVLDKIARPVRYVARQKDLLG